MVKIFNGKKIVTINVINNLNHKGHQSIEKMTHGFLFIFLSFYKTEPNYYYLPSFTLFQNKFYVKQKHPFEI